MSRAICSAVILVVLPIAACNTKNSSSGPVSSSGPAVVNNCTVYEQNPPIEAAVEDYRVFSREKLERQGWQEGDVENKIDWELRLIGLVDNPSAPEAGAPTRDVLLGMPSHAARDFSTRYCSELIDDYFRYLFWFDPAKRGTIDEEMRELVGRHPIGPLSDALLACAAYRKRGSAPPSYPVAVTLSPEHESWNKRYDELLQSTVCAQT
ncbi:hypothetical protein [Nocardia lasii]|uniref:DUF2599 domain-containing protein n=1 Tax=Nocardia lasii TaxID=1616107 RepID=A0ABW1JSA4_9NOCA